MRMRLPWVHHNIDRGDILSDQDKGQRLNPLIRCAIQVTEGGNLQVTRVPWRVAA